MKDNLNKTILFITDIHQNINAVKKIDFANYDLIMCGGDLLNPSKPDIEIAKEIINLFPEETYIVPGNCDKDPLLIEYMKKKLNLIHKKQIENDGIQILGIGYCRELIEDMRVYRKFFMEDKNRINLFLQNSKLKFLLDFCGIRQLDDKTYTIIDEKDAYIQSIDFINKFAFFKEQEIDDLFLNINSFNNDIFLVHSPPYGALDKLDGLPNIGSYSIYRGIKKIKPRIVLCGHFHEFSDKTYIDNSIIFNPGALKDNKYGIIKINNKNIETQFMSI